MRKCVTVSYNEHLWVGIILDFSQVAEELKVKFMTSHGARKAYAWPIRDDICWIPKQKVIRIQKIADATSLSENRRCYTCSD